jgi:hypothetical protein
MLVFVTPTVALLGESDAVSVEDDPVTVRLTEDAACVTEPLAPCRVMLPYVPAAVLAAVWIVKVAVADEFEGTVTDCGDQDAVAPGTCDQFIAAGITVPAKPDTLLNITAKLADEPRATVWLVVLTEALKFPVPL